MSSKILEEVKKIWEQEKPSRNQKTYFEKLSKECGQFCYLTPWNVLKESSLNISEQEMENLVNSWFE